MITYICRKCGRESLPIGRTEDKPELRCPYCGEAYGRERQTMKDEGYIDLNPLHEHKTRMTKTKRRMLAVRIGVALLFLLFLAVLIGSVLL